MRYLLPVAAAAFLGLMMPALAQVTEEQLATATTAIDELELSDDNHLNMWCGAAFGLVAEQLKAVGDDASAATLDPLQTAVFTVAATDLMGAGMTQEEFGELAGHFAVLALGQIDEGGEADYTQEQCIEAATTAAE